MTITAALVLFTVIWFLLLFMALPIGQTSQEEDGHRVAGTPASAPINPMIGKKMFWVTVVTFVLWLPLCLFIVYGPVTMADLDFYDRNR